jgi:hypothetical protein
LCSDAVWRKGLLSIATYVGKSRRVARATRDTIKEQIRNTVYFHLYRS